MIKWLPFLGIVALAACATAPENARNVVQSRPSPDSRSPPPTVALEREVRFYVDEQGNVWDDRGRRREGAAERIVR